MEVLYGKELRFITFLIELLSLCPYENNPSKLYISVYNKFKYIYLKKNILF